MGVELYLGSLVVGRVPLSNLPYPSGVGVEMGKSREG